MQPTSRLLHRKSVTFDGHEDEPNYFVRLNAAQKSSGAPFYGPGGITGWASYLTDAPSLQARFTTFAIPANEYGANHFRDDWGYLIANLTDCQFSGANQGGYVSTQNYTNCLFDREALWLQTGAADDAIPSGATPSSDGFDAWTWISTNPTSLSSNPSTRTATVFLIIWPTGTGTAGLAPFGARREGRAGCDHPRR